MADASSIGDDGCVSIWSLESYEKIQSLKPHDLGQITALVWLKTGSSEDDGDAELLSLGVGTGRGALVIYSPSYDSLVRAQHTSVPALV
jgi:hypothetical protein